MTNFKSVPTSQIRPGSNDRTKFDQSALQELADSIEAHGLAQPITVRPILDGLFEIVAGERRFRAVRDILGRPDILAIVRTDLTDEAASAIMLAENVARQDLDPMDEARAYQVRIDAYGWTVSDCAQQAGVSAIRVRFRLKLLDLRGDVQKLVSDGHLALGYARILADANLDANRQMLAISRLRDNPSPTPVWFRREVAGLLEDQSQESLFDMDALIMVSQAPERKSAFVEPPHPTTTTPPCEGATPRDRLINQVTFWRKAADAWDALGKPFKRQECEAAAQALTMALAVI